MTDPGYAARNSSANSTRDGRLRVDTPADTWPHTFPVVRTCPEKVQSMLIKRSRLTAVPAGVCIMHDGEACRRYLLVRSGTLRVEKITADGHEITLYRVQAGEGCELSAISLLALRPYPADVFTETAADVISVEKDVFHTALNDIPGFREFVFGSIGRGLDELITRLADVSFGRTHRRLAQCLVEHAALEPGSQLHITHHDLAVDVGTAREVVSRLLKRFEVRGLVRLHRGRVEIIDGERLEALAREH